MIKYRKERNYTKFDNCNSTCSRGLDGLNNLSILNKSLNNKKSDLFGINNVKGFFNNKKSMMRFTAFLFMGLVVIFGLLELFITSIKYHSGDL